MSLIEKAAEKLKKKESLIEQAARKMADAPPADKGVVPAGKDVAPAENVETQQPAAPREPQVPDMPPVQPVSVAPRTAASGRRRVEIDREKLIEKNILTMDDTDSPIAEEFRIIKRTLLLNAFSKGGADTNIKNGNIIMVTSTQPNEGKTYCALSLAMSMATERDLTVLLVDADVVKPDILKYLGSEGGKGLIDVIEDRSLDLADCLLRTSIDNLSILPAGKKHKLTTELLASDRMGNIIKEIAARYPDRVIIVDSPPVLASSAASVLALNVGQIVFVVEAERTLEADVKEALSMVGSCKNINMVLNKSRFTVGNKKFGSYYGYGHD